MATTIADFLIEIGVKADGVEKLQKRLDTTLNSFIKQTTSIRQLNKGLREQVQLMKRLNQLQHGKEKPRPTQPKVSRPRGSPVDNADKVADALRGIRRSAAFESLLPKQKEVFEMRMSTAKTARNVKHIRQDMAQAARHARRLTYEQQKASFAAKSMADSSKNMARSYISMFAVVAGVGGITKMGQDFESLRASMLVASGGAQQAKEDLKFVGDEARRLGIDLKTATDGFAKLGIAARGKMQREDVRALFTSFSEYATAIKVSDEQRKSGLRA